VFIFSGLYYEGSLAEQLKSQCLEKFKGNHTHNVFSKNPLSQLEVILFLFFSGVMVGRRESVRERTKTDRIKEDVLKCGENKKGRLLNLTCCGNNTDHSVLSNFKDRSFLFIS